MKLLSPDSLDEFSPEHYVAILADIAHSDGIDPEEQAILEALRLPVRRGFGCLAERPG